MNFIKTFSILTTDNRNENKKTEKSSKGEILEFAIDRLLTAEIPSRVQ